MFRHIFLIVLFLVFVIPLNAQNPTTEGVDFWVTFLYNYDEDPDELKLIVAGQNCQGVVTNPRTGYRQEFEVVAGDVTNVVVPAEECYTTSLGQPSFTALHITTTDTVSLYASNFKANTFDVTNVLPTPTLSDSYMLQTYAPGSGNGEFAILAVEDETVIDITSTASSADGQLLKDSTITITLDSGEVYMQFSSRQDEEFSGTTIFSHDCKPVAVFQGNVCTYIPIDQAACDHIYEQAIPTAYWGRRFVVTSSMMRTNDRVRITALHDGCLLYRNGVFLTTLRAGHTFEYEQDAMNQAVFLETTKPAAVYLYFTGGDYGGDTGDPSMVLINPIEQRMDEVTFGTFTTESTDDHFVNIVTQTSDVPSVMLDSLTLASQFIPVPGKPEYSFARVPISYGSHTLRSNSGGFVAHVYGLGWYESYSYSVGSNAIPLNQLLYVDEVPVTHLDGRATACQRDTVHFRLESDASIQSIEWHFGDGATDTGIAVTHVYNRAGDFSLSANIAYTLARCGGSLSDSISYPVHIYPSYRELQVEDTCRGTFIWHDSAYSQSGTYHYDLTTIQGCDSILELQLLLHNLAEPSIGSVPPYADEDHLAIRLSDEGKGAVSHRWEIASVIKYEKTFIYDYPVDFDSVEVMLIAIGKDDCPDTARYNLRRERLRIWAPNIITPKLDANNRFFVVGNDILDIEVIIYDRNGRIVGRIEKLGDTWDATYNGTPVPQGAYRYNIRYTSRFEPSRPRLQQGTVTVVY